MNKPDFIKLAGKIADGTATEDEILLYNQYFGLFQEQENWDEKILGNQKEIGDLLLKRIHHAIEPGHAQVKTLPQFKQPWVRVAAAILVILSGSLFLLLSNREHRPQMVSARGTSTQTPKLLPGTNTATLVLDNGATIILDDAQNGTIAKQGSTKVLKLNGGQLAYEATSGKEGLPTPVSINTLSTPNGGQYQLTLPDGSMVWLNAGSSIKFPTNFTGTERKVELTGEAYFEVAKNAAMPFKVYVNEMEVTVLGTHFNIMGYPDEPVIKTSLLEGSVRVQNGQNTALLKPGQQSQLNRNGLLKVVDDANMQEVMAWKNGLFYFDGADIETVMRQIARWYNVEVTYQGRVDQHFSGKISRNVDASKVFQLLELTEKVHFRTEGRKIMISQ